MDRHPAPCVAGNMSTPGLLINMTTVISASDKNCINICNRETTVSLAAALWYNIGMFLGPNYTGDVINPPLYSQDVCILRGPTISLGTKDPYKVDNNLETNVIVAALCVCGNHTNLKD